MKLRWCKDNGYWKPGALLFIKKCLLFVAGTSGEKIDALILSLDDEDMWSAHEYCQYEILMTMVEILLEQSHDD